jgi:hypothetical protein
MWSMLENSEHGLGELDWKQIARDHRGTRSVRTA